MKRDSSIHCDELISLPKLPLTCCVGRLSASKIDDLNRALLTALDLDES